jgi:hypothetical protein
MTLILAPTELRAVARTTFTWVDGLQSQVSRVGRSREWAADADAALAAVSRQAADISWGTPEATSTSVPRLITALNDVAIHGGTVDAVTGAAKPRDLHEALAAAKRAHGAVQDALMERGWHPNGREYYWPS